MYNVLQILRTRFIQKYYLNANRSCFNSFISLREKGKRWKCGKIPSYVLRISLVSLNMPEELYCFDHRYSIHIHVHIRIHTHTHLYLYMHANYPHLNKKRDLLRRCFSFTIPRFRDKTSATSFQSTQTRKLSLTRFLIFR